jgi:hypothetical protein
LTNKNYSVNYEYSAMHDIMISNNYHIDMLAITNKYVVKLCYLIYDFLNNYVLRRIMIIYYINSFLVAIVNTNKVKFGNIPDRFYMT